LLQKDQSRSRFGNLYQELLQTERRCFDLLESPFAENQSTSRFAFKISYSHSNWSVKLKRLEIYGMKKTGPQSFAIAKKHFDQSCFKEVKTGNECLYQLDQLLTLLQSDLAHCNIDQLFDFKILNNAFLKMS
jgi:hypothetical protein